MCRHRCLGGLAALAVAAAMGLVAGCGSERGPERVAPAEATTAPSTTVAEVDEPGPTTTDTVEDTAEDTPPPPDAGASVVVASGVEIPSPFASSPTDADFTPTQWLVPWSDGFLALGMSASPTPLPPELPPEIAELFPPEVTELFPDGLPPTQAEATAILDEAGLLDVVMDVLAEHPEASDALLSVPPPPPRLMARWTLDGEDWEPVDSTTPDGMGHPMAMAILGDRLTFVSVDGPAAFGAIPRVSIATTTDLREWTVDGFDVVSAAGYPERVNVWADPMFVAANDEYWVVEVVTHAFVDPAQLLPESAFDVLEVADTWLNVDDDGVVVERMEDGEVVVVERFGWETLGVDDDVIAYLDGGEMTSTRWTAAWGEEPFAGTVDEFVGGPLLATTSGFLDFTDGVSHSLDGRTWTPRSTAGSDLVVVSAVPLDDDVLVAAIDDAHALSFHRLDATGSTWTPIDLPDDLLEGAHTWMPTFSPAFVLESGIEDHGPIVLVVEVDGFELTLEYGEVNSYRLVDAATGAPVIEEQVDSAEAGEGPDSPFEHLADGPGGITVTDPETAEVLVTVPHELVSRAWDEAFAEQGGQQPPEWWVLATGDGETWLSADLDAGDGEPATAPAFVATDGEVVLVGSFGWEEPLTSWARYVVAD